MISKYPFLKYNNKGFIYMKKAILLARVSTLYQNFESQLDELQFIAYKDGYSDDEIIKIYNKESGLKNIHELEGIKQLKIYIEANNIEAVYVWEISRIARKQSTIYDVINELKNKHIQLVIANPYIKMFRNNGSINKSFDIVLQLYAQLAEIEVEQFISRTTRAKKYLASHGKYMGGPKLYGYDYDNEGYYIIQDNEADIIKFIYELYVNNNFGYSIIQKKLKERNIKMSLSQIQRILSESGYTGDIMLQSSEKRPQLYPTIISSDIFKKAELKRLNNTENLQGDIPTNYYYAYKLIKCDICNHFFRCYDKETYQCWYHSFRNKDYEKCTNKISISVKLLDFILYYTVFGTSANFELGNKDYFEKIQNSILNISINVFDNLNGRKSKIIYITDKNNNIFTYIIWGCNPARKIYKKIQSNNINENNYIDIQLFNGEYFFNIEKLHNI